MNVSSPQAVKIAADKRATHRFFNEVGVHTVRNEELITAVRQHEEWAYPVSVKPSDGSAGIGVREIGISNSFCLSPRAAD